jgi:signal transduction histidine kinase
MSPNNDPMNDVRFFGTLAAAMTHDMKNFMAIVNENAGLLADLAVKAQHQAVPVDPLKAKTISEKIGKQVARADTLIKRFNRFAHSMDREKELVDLEEAVDLVAHLAERIFRQNRICLTVIPAPAPCRIHACRFALLHLIYRAMDILCRHQTGGTSDFEKPVTVRFGTDPNRPEICFVWNTGPVFETPILFAGPEDQALLARINMNIRTMDSGAGFCLYPLSPGRE